MAEQPRPADSPPAPDKGSGIAGPSPAIPPTDAPPATDPATANKLTPEEQMALFEKDLKEKDWGHQPC